MAEPVRLDLAGPLAVITIDEPATRNALSPAIVDLMRAYVQQIEMDDSVRLLGITGAGGVFCSGAAIRAWEALPDAGAVLTDRGTALCEHIAALPIPVVACLEGHAVGGGAELALAADWRIAAPAAEFRFVHTGFGLIPGFGGLARLERLVGRPAAMRLLATRGAVHAHDATTVGLVDEVVLAGDQRTWLEARAADVAGSPREAIAALKQAMDTGDERAAFLRVWPQRQLPERLGS